jgi:hypothetical protein
MTEPIFTLRILGFDVPVILQDDLSREYSRDGHYDPRKQQIKMYSEITDQRKFNLLLHEILEALDTEMNLGLKHDEQLSKLEIGLTQVFRDNAEILKRLF